MSREYDCAIQQYRHALEIAPNYATAWRGLGLTYAQRGMFPEAIDALRKAADRAPGYLGDLAYAQALTGEMEAARATLARAKAEPQNGFSIARAYVALHQPDSAFAWLERSSWRWPHEANRADPALDPPRSDPRFAKLVVQVDREMGVQ
jgi:Flp pilus assembly protein TadD